MWNFELVDRASYRFLIFRKDEQAVGSIDIQEDTSIIDMAEALVKYAKSLEPHTNPVREAR